MINFNINALLFYNVLLCCLLISYNINLSNAWCWQINWNPSIDDAPSVTQVTSDSVLVSWKNIVKMRECVDNFVVKYWKTSTPKRFIMSDLISVDADGVVLKDIEPGIQYTYQVIAREDKSLSRVDYNRSPTISFRASPTFKYSEDTLQHDDISLIVANTSSFYNDLDIASVNNSIKDHSTEKDMKKRSRVHPTMMAFIIAGVLVVVLFLVGIVYNLGKQKKDDGIID